MSLDPQTHLQILALYAEYNRTIDAGDVSGWLATFLSDGVFYHPTRDYVGHAELRAFIANRSAQLGTHALTQLRHWNDTIVLTSSAARVSGTCQVVVVGVARDTNRPEVLARGRYEDSLVREGGSWYFNERRLQLL